MISSFSHLFKKPLNLPSR